MYIYIYIYIYIGLRWQPPARNPGVSLLKEPARARVAPGLPAKIVPVVRFCRLETSGKFRMDMRIPPLKIEMSLESNPLKSRILARRLAVL